MTIEEFKEKIRADMELANKFNEAMKEKANPVEAAKACGFDVEVPDGVELSDDAMDEAAGGSQGADIFKQWFGCKCGDWYGEGLNRIYIPS